MASDFHTHYPAPEIRALVSTEQYLPGYLSSLEFHPWYLEKNAKNFPNPSYLMNFCALGEVGLDKLRGPEMPIQQQYLIKLLDMAADCRKPVVIHCVKAYQEFFDISKRYNLKFMIHGFRSSLELLRELWKRNITVSFHPSMAENRYIMAELTKSPGAFGFESDNNSSISIPDVICKAEKNSGVANMEKITDQHFSDFLEI